MINVPRLTALELYQHSKPLFLSGNSGERDYTNANVTWDLIPNHDIVLEFQNGSNIANINGFYFNEILQYQTQNQETAQLAVFEYNNYYIFDYTFCFFHDSYCYSWTTSPNVINYTQLYANERYTPINVVTLSPDNISINNTYGVSYYQYGQPISYDNRVLPNTIFNCYNLTIQDTTIISGLNAKLQQNYELVEGSYFYVKINGVNQKNTIVYHLATHNQTTINVTDTVFLNNNINIRYQGTFTAPTASEFNANHMYRAKLIPIGIEKNVVDSYIELGNNTTASTRLLDTTLEATNTLYIAPFLTVTFIVTGIIGFGLFKLIKGLFT